MWRAAEVRLAERDGLLTALYAGPDVLAVRVNGRPSNPVDGLHRRVVAYVAPDIGRHELAELLRDAAEQLETRRG